MITLRNNQKEIVALLTLAEYCALSPAQIINLIKGGK